MMMEHTTIAHELDQFSQLTSSILSAYDNKKHAPAKRKFVTARFNTDVIEQTIAALTAFEKHIADKTSRYISDLRSLGEQTARNLENKNSDPVSLKTVSQYHASCKLVDHTALGMARAVHATSKRFYAHKIAMRLKYIKAWKQRVSDDGDDGDFPAAYKRVYDMQEPMLRSVMLRVKTSLQAEFGRLSAAYDNAIKNLQDIQFYQFPVADLKLASERNRKTSDAMKSMAAKLVDLTEKVDALLYKSGVMDFVLDTTFYATYFLKLVHYAIMLLAWYLAEKLFSEIYMKRVYAQNSDPPTIYKMLGIFLGIDAMFLVFLFTILVLVMYTIGKSSVAFIINGELLKLFMLDCVISHIMIVLFGLMLGSVLQRKRYFRYKTEGLRGIRAYKAMMLAVSAALVALPYFIFF